MRCRHMVMQLPRALCSIHVMYLRIRNKPRPEGRSNVSDLAGAHAVSFRYLIRCGWSASLPRRRFRSSSYS